MYSLLSLGAVGVGEARRPVLRAIAAGKEVIAFAFHCAIPHTAVRQRTIAIRAKPRLLKILCLRDGITTGTGFLFDRFRFDFRLIQIYSPMARKRPNDCNYATWLKTTILQVGLRYTGYTGTPILIHQYLLSGLIYDRSYLDLTTSADLQSICAKAQLLNL